MGKTLSDAAITDIRRMKADIRRLFSELGIDYRKSGRPQSHYLVLTPEGGIPASAAGVPGEAACQISRRWGSADPKEIEDTSTEINVYNYAETAIDGGTYIIAHCDAWGDYYAVSGSAGVVADIIIKAPSGGIPPRIGLILGSATCDKYVLNDTTGLLEDSTENVTVKNWASSAVCDNGDRYGIASYIEGEWVVISEDCGDTGTTTGPGTGSFTSGTLTSSFPDLDSDVLPDAGVFTSGAHSRTTNLTPGFE